jgi:hypothetical protein
LEGVKKKSRIGGAKILFQMNTKYSLKLKLKLEIKANRILLMKLQIVSLFALLAATDAGVTFPTVAVSVPRI